MPQRYIPLSRLTSATDDGSLETDDGFTPKQPELAPRGFHAKTKRHIIFGLAGVAVLILIFAFSAPKSVSWPQWSPGSNSTGPSQRGCGVSPEEAAEAGCKFDVMAFTWTQPACYDQDLTDEFLGLQEWSWWSDVEGTAAVSREEVAKGSHEQLFISWQYQLEQCVYLWKKMQRAVAAKSPLDSYTLDPEHTTQCGEMLLDRKGPAEETNTMITTKYTSCAVEE